MAKEPAGHKKDHSSATKSGNHKRRTSLLMKSHLKIWSNKFQVLQENWQLRPTRRTMPLQKTALQARQSKQVPPLLRLRELRPLRHKLILIQLTMIQA